MRVYRKLRKITGRVRKGNEGYGAFRKWERALPAFLFFHYNCVREIRQAAMDLKKRIWYNHNGDVFPAICKTNRHAAGGITDKLL